MKTQDSLREGSEKTCSPSALAVRWIGIVAPVAGCIDLIVSMIRMPLPDEYEVASSMSGPLAATTLFAAALFAILWGIIVVIGRRLRAIPAVPLFIALTVGALCLELLLLLLGVLVPSELAADPATTLLKLGAGGVVALVLLRGGYLLGQDISRGFHTRRSPALVVLSAPFLGASTLLMLWFTRLRMDAPLLSREALLTIALVGLMDLALLIFFYMLGHRRLVRNAAFIPLCVILLAPLLSEFGFSHGNLPAKPTATSQKNPNVFLITIDSLRADVLSCYGSSNVQTRNIDAIAGDGVVFNMAISASSWTLPSVASFMTGVSPVVHGATAWQKRLPDDFKTLAEYFKEAGYQTRALGQNPVLDKARNLDQGFDTYDWISTENRHPGVSIGRRILECFDTHVVESTTEAITRMAIEGLGQLKEGPAFFWVHYYDPHMPYTPPRRFVDDSSPLGLAFEDMERVRMGRFATTKAERDWVRGLYEGEVRFVDEEIGRLIAALKDRGLYDGAIIILASDHGEEFWEHGGFEHGHSMHQEVLRVPLIIKQPGPARPERVETTVGMEGLTPTLLTLAGISFDGKNMTSSSFAASLNPDAPPATPHPVSSFGTLYFEKLEAVTGPQFKYIRSVEFGHEVLYDRLLDPLELRPIEAGENPAAAERARGLLDRAHNKGQTVQATDQKDVVLDAGTEDSLRSLGYID